MAAERRVMSRYVNLCCVEENEVVGMLIFAVIPDPLFVSPAVRVWVRTDLQQPVGVKYFLSGLGSQIHWLGF